ncbi:hypothetical protein TURU_058440 [Turdus rufiventris]|nr:hypothetical protein TURU_058440 [Turdus rufiventris]
MEFNRCLGASAEEEKGRQEGGEEDINNAGSSAVHEELDLEQMYLTCLPEQYMKVKFTQTAYLTCWLLLKLCKKCVTEEMYNDDDGVETTGVGPGGASAAAATSPLLHAHGSFGAVATSVF